MQLLRFAALVLCVCPAWCQTRYRVDAFAGSNYAGDRQTAVSAPLLQPQGLAFERNGSVVVADAADHRIRRITLNGLIETIAGDGWPGFAGDGGPAAAARLQTPYGITVGPNGDLYIADLGNARIRRVGQDGQIRTFAGGGEKVPTADSPVKATEAKLQQPRNLVIDANGVLYISDFGAHFVYRVTAEGMMFVVAGTGEAGDSGDDKASTKTKLSGPAGLAVDSAGALFVADSGNHRVRRIVNGWIDSVRDASNNKLDFGTVTSIALDRNGRLYAAGGDRIPIVAANGSVSAIDILADELALDLSGRLLTVAHRQIRVHGATTTTLLAGTGSGGFFGDGASSDQWRFQKPTGIARDETGNLYIADTANGRVRRIAPDGTLSTIAAGLGQPSYFAFDRSNLLYFSDSKNHAVYSIDRAGRTQVFSKGNGAKPFRAPTGIGFDMRGDLYVADTGNGLIRKVTPDGFVSIIAGGGSSDKDGFALSLELKNPVGIAIDSDGTLWFTESTRLRKLTPDGKVATIPGVPLLDARGLRIDGKNRIWITDAGANRIICVSMDGKWEPLAGSGERGHAGDGGLALPALFDGPADVLPDLDGAILVADTGNNRIRRLTASADPAAPSPSPIPIIPTVSVLHPGTLRQQAVAPGQVVFIDAPDVVPAGAIEVRFGSTVARVISVEGKRITAVVPMIDQFGFIPLTIAGAYIASGRAEIAVLAPAILGAIENEDRSLNAPATPAIRGTSVTIYIAGEGDSPAPSIYAQLGGEPMEVLFVGKTDSKPGLLKIILQVPGGYFVTGSHLLQLWVDGVKTFEDATIVCR